MTTPVNILQQVVTYNLAKLAFLQNAYCAISLANKTFKNFQDIQANRGDTVSWDLAPRARAKDGLVVNFQQSEQRVQTMTCSQAKNVGRAFSAQQFIFNVDDYMSRFGKADAMELGAEIESDILRNAVSGVIASDIESSIYGQKQTNSGPYRFFGDGRTPVNSYGQLAQAIADFQDYGAAPNIHGILPLTIYPGIVNTGLNQFAMDRNNENARSWQIGDFANAMWHKSNLLPTHIAGSVGDAVDPANCVLTLVSTNDPTGQNVTRLTVTEPTAGTVAQALKSGDLGEFIDGASGVPNIRYLTFIGHKPSGQRVQIRVVDDAPSVAGTITFDVFPALVWAATENQNLTTALAAGMQIRIMPSHRAGVVFSGDSLYLAAPRLPDEVPFPTGSETDPDSGMSLRTYYGSQFGQNTRGMVTDQIWGSTLVPENSQRILIPLSQR